LALYYLNQYVPYSKKIINTLGTNAEKKYKYNRGSHLTLREIVLQELEEVKT